MKSTVLQLKVLAMTLCFTLFSQLISAQKTKKTETVLIKTTISCDHCNKCESCGGRIEKGLAFEKGVKKIIIDEKAMTIAVTYNPAKTNKANIKKAISKLGYDADDVKADPIAYEKLDVCCKK